MGPLRRCAVPLVLLVAAACGNSGGAGPEPGRVLTAAGATGEEAPVPTAPPAPPVLPSTTTIATTTTTTSKRPTPTTTTTAAAPRTRTTRAPVTATPPIAGYSPAPPPPGVAPDGYGGYGGFTEASVAGVNLELSVYPREVYFGEIAQMGASVTHPPGTAITSLKVDFGNGHVVTGQPSTGWYCDATASAGVPAWYVYPAPGTYKITATVTFVACQGVPGMYIGPYFPPPAGLVGPWFPQPHQSVTAAMDVLIRPDRPPLPVGPPPGP